MRVDQRIVHYYLEWARTRFWLIPLSMCAVSPLLAWGALSLDKHCEWCVQAGPALSLSVAATRDLMGVLATSILSVGGVSFSITMVALSMTSGQYGPKVMRYFLADTRSKISLGLFFSTALFALGVFVGVEPPMQPRLSVLAAVTLALLALVEFMRFIHRTTTDLQADEIIQRLGQLTRRDLRKLQKSQDDGDGRRSNNTQTWRKVARGITPITIPSHTEGYIQTVDIAGMVEVLTDHDAVAMLRARPGDFVLNGQHVITVWPNKERRNKTAPEKFAGYITTGDIRTAVDDVQFPITQIQQIAARALSPGINDPGTAITCIDWLTVCLGEVVDDDFLGNVFHDQGRQARLLMPRLGFEKLCDSVYSPPRRLSAENLPVAVCLMDSKTRLASLTQRPDRLAIIRGHAELLIDCVEDAQHSDYDMSMIRRRYNKLRRLTERANG